MSLPRSVAVILREHVTLEVERLDRMKLNVYVPQLQHERDVVALSIPNTHTMRCDRPFHHLGLCRHRSAQ